MRQLGLPRTDQDDEKKINEHIDKLNFDFVILTEHFDECLVLLRRKLCWDFQSILYMKLRVAKDRRVHILSRIYKKSYPNLEKTKAMLHESYKNWSRADYILYERMNTTFWANYNKEKDISEEVEYFKSVQKKVEYFCGNDPSLKLLNTNVSLFIQKFNPKSSLKLKFEQNKWHEAFSLDSSQCLLYKANDNTLRKLFK